MKKQLLAFHLTAALALSTFAFASDAPPSKDEVLAKLEASTSGPQPLKTCAAIMDEAVTQEQHAIVSVQFDLWEEVNAHSQRSTSLMQSAFKCAEAAEFTPDGYAVFKTSMDEWKAQHSVLTAATAAKLKTMK